MTEVNLILGELVDHEMKRAGLNQAELAEKLGEDKHKIWRLINHNTCDIDLLKKLCKFFKKSADYFISD